MGSSPVVHSSGSFSGFCIAGVASSGVIKINIVGAGVPGLAALARKTFAWHKTTLAWFRSPSVTSTSIMPTVPPPSRDAALETRVFWERFKVEIAAVLLIALLAIIGFGVYRFYSDRRNAAASALLGNARK